MDSRENQDSFIKSLNRYASMYYHSPAADALRAEDSGVREREREIVSVRPENAEETTTLLPATNPEPEKTSSMRRPSRHL